jgi:hypothetical protein
MSVTNRPTKNAPNAEAAAAIGESQAGCGVGPAKAWVYSHPPKMPKAAPMRRETNHHGSPGPGPGGNGHRLGTVPHQPVSAHKAYSISFPPLHGFKRQYDVHSLKLRAFRTLNQIVAKEILELRSRNVVVLFKERFICPHQSSLRPARARLSMRFLDKKLTGCMGGFHGRLCET